MEEALPMVALFFAFIPKHQRKTHLPVNFLITNSLYSN
jgi:hypothetical protein